MNVTGVDVTGVEEAGLDVTGISVEGDKEEKFESGTMEGAPVGALLVNRSEQNW